MFYANICLFNKVYQIFRAFIGYKVSCAFFIFTDQVRRHGIDMVQ